MVDASQQVAKKNRSSVLSDARSTSCNRMPCGQNIMRGVNVTIMSRAAITNPTPIFKGETLVDCPTNTAHLCAGKPAVNLDYGFSVHGRFGLNGPDGVADTGVVETAGKTVVFCHASQIQIFDADRVKSGTKIPCQFAQGVFARIGYLLMHLGYLLALQAVTVRALLFAGKGLLRPFELLFVFIKIARVRHFLAGGQRRKTVDTEVNANILAGLGQGSWLDIDNHRDKIFTGRSKANSHGGRISRHTARPFDLESPHLGNYQPLISDFKAEGRPGVFRRLLAGLLLEGRVAGALFKEVAEGGLQITKRLLHRHTGNVV